MTHIIKFATALAAVVLVVIGICVWSFRTTVQTIAINGTELTVRVAERPFAQTRGLGGYTKDSLQEDGMLFLFSDAEVRTFWMKGMRFNLDILWIADGKIVAIDRDVQAPYSRSDDPEQVSSAPLKVDAVLELPAGGAYTFGLIEGMTMVLP